MMVLVLLVKLLMIVGTTSIEVLLMTGGGGQGVKMSGTGGNVQGTISSCLWLG